MEHFGGSVFTDGDTLTFGVVTTQLVTFLLTGKREVFDMKRNSSLASSVQVALAL